MCLGRPTTPGEREARRARVRELREQGLTHHEIAAALGVHTSTVQEDLSVVGDPRPRRPSPRGTRERRQRAHLLRKSGMTQAAIAKELRVTQQAVAGYLAEPPPPRWGETPRTARISVARLARRIHDSERFTRELLDDWAMQGWVDECNGGWAFTADGVRRFGDVRALEEDPQPKQAARPKPPSKPKPVTVEPEEKPGGRQGWCSCGCGARVEYARNQLRAYAPGHEPVEGKPLSPKQWLRREGQAAADAKPVTSTCARCGASFGPGPVSAVREEFKQHACGVAA